jgi:hypothetical protein
VLTETLKVFQNMFLVVKLLSGVSWESSFGEASFIQIKFVHQQILSATRNVHCEAKRKKRRLRERKDFIAENHKWFMIITGIEGGVYSISLILSISAQQNTALRETFRTLKAQ